jgi:signal transduction histidine kinase
VVAVVRRWLPSLARSVIAPLTAGGAIDPGAAQSRRGRIDWYTVVDIIAAAVLYGVTTGIFISLSERLAVPYPPQLMHLLGAGAGVPVALRRHRPLLAWQICLVSVVAAGGWFGPLFEQVPFVPTQVIAYVLCLYTVASRHSREVTIGAWLWSVVGIIIVATAGPALGPQAAIVWTWSMVFVTLPLVFAHNVGTRRRVERALEEQERRSRSEQAERAMLEERSRIARELHDVVAHNMSVIAIQAEAAPLKAPDDAAALAEELAGIRATALETLTEMRRVLGVLRDRNEVVDTTPAPGIDQLAALIERVRAAGMDVHMTTSGTARPVAPGIGVSVYRIVQESLSNALRHAPGAKVGVELTYRDAPGSLVVRVENGPPPSAPPSEEDSGARHGLVGMRERAAMLHGEFRAQPTTAGGFVVEATLPLQAPPPERGSRGAPA